MEYVKVFRGERLEFPEENDEGGEDYPEGICSCHGEDIEICPYGGR